jgi:glucose-1-phosphate cytidylyltransferase
MKVVLFCGGQGMRLRGVYDDIPKPLVEIGGQPILWHIMRYYSYYGHRDFILCLGHQGERIEAYFRSRPEQTEGWRITFADTGVGASIGERLSVARSYLEGEDVFLANYADGLTDAPLHEVVDGFLSGSKIGVFLCVKPSLSYHFVKARADGTVTEIALAHEVDLRVNGGYFVFRRQIFDHLRRGEDLIGEPFQRLVRREALQAHLYDGFWKNMDTFKDKQALDELCADGRAPWEVWKRTDGR